jgi:hypothetical protein
MVNDGLISLAGQTEKATHSRPHRKPSSWRTRDVGSGSKADVDPPVGRNGTQLADGRNINRI